MPPRDLFWKCAALVEVDPQLAAIKLAQVPPELQALKKSVMGGLPQKDANLTELQKSFRNNFRPGLIQDLQALKKNVLGSIRLANYDPDVEFYEDLPFQMGTGDGNAAENPEFDFTAPKPGDPRDASFYSVNTENTSNTGDIWDRLFSRTEATSRPAATTVPFPRGS